MDYKAGPSFAYRLSCDDEEELEEATKDYYVLITASHEWVANALDPRGDILTFPFDSARGNTCFVLDLCRKKGWLLTYLTEVAIEVVHWAQRQALGSFAGANSSRLLRDWKLGALKTLENVLLKIDYINVQFPESTGKLDAYIRYLHKARRAAKIRADRPEMSLVATDYDYADDDDDVVLGLDGAAQSRLLDQDQDRVAEDEDQPDDDQDDEDGGLSDVEAPTSVDIAEALNWDEISAVAKRAFSPIDCGAAAVESAVQMTRRRFFEAGGGGFQGEDPWEHLVVETKEAVGITGSEENLDDGPRRTNTRNFARIAMETIRNTLVGLCEAADRDAAAITANVGDDEEEDESKEEEARLYAAPSRRGRDVSFARVMPSAYKVILASSKPAMRLSSRTTKGSSNSVSS